MISSKMVSPLKFQRHISVPKFSASSMVDQITFALNVSVERNKKIISKEHSIDTSLEGGQITANLEKHNKLLKSELKYLNTYLDKLLDIKAENVHNEKPEIKIRTSRLRNKNTADTVHSENREERLAVEYNVLKERIGMLSNTDYLFNLKQKLIEVDSNTKKLAKHKKNIEVKPITEENTILQLKKLQKELFEVKNDYLRVDEKCESLREKPTEFIDKSSKEWKEKYKSLIEDCYSLDINPNLASYLPKPPSEKQIQLEKYKVYIERSGANIKNIKSKIKRIELESESALRKYTEDIDKLQIELNAKIQYETYQNESQFGYRFGESHQENKKWKTRNQ